MPEAVTLPFMDVRFKRRSIEAVRELANVHGPLFRFLLPFGGCAWLVTDHALAVGLLADPRLSKTAPTADPDSTVRHALYRHPLVMDPPEHTRFRRYLHQAMAHWTNQAIKELARTVIGRRLDEVARHGPGFDLVSALTMPVALEIACTLAGVPSCDMRRVHAWNDALTRADLSGQDNAYRIAEEINGYFAKLESDGQVQPNGGALSVLTSAARRREIKRDEAFAMAYLLLSAGYETTGHLLTSATALLIRHPRVWRELPDNASLAARAVEECLRLRPSLELSTPRHAREAIAIADRLVEPGDQVFVAIGVVNRDESIFPDAGALHCGRHNLPQHLSFGRGPHACPGATVARITTRMTLQMLANRYPGLVAEREASDGAWIPGLVMRGVRSYPVLTHGH